MFEIQKYLHGYLEQEKTIGKTQKKCYNMNLNNPLHVMGDVFERNTITIQDHHHQICNGHFTHENDLEILSDINGLRRPL